MAGRSATPALAFERLCAARNAEIARLNGIYLQMLERAGVRAVPGPCPPPARRAGEASSSRPAASEVTAARVLIAVGARPEPARDARASSSPSPPTRCWRTSTPCPSAWPWSVPAISASSSPASSTAWAPHTTLILRGDLPLRGFEHDLRQHLTVEVEGHGVSSVERDPGRARSSAAAGGLQLRHQPRPARGRRRDLRHRPRADAADRAASAWRSTASRLQPDRHGRGRRRLPQQRARHLRGRRLQRPCRHGAGRRAVRPDAGRDRRGPGGGRDACSTPTRCEVNYDTIPTAVFALPQAASVGLSEAKARAARPRGHRSTAPASGRCSTR